MLTWLTAFYSVTRGRFSLKLYGCGVKNATSTGFIIKNLFWRSPVYPKAAFLSEIHVPCACSTHFLLWVDYVVLMLLTGCCRVTAWFKLTGSGSFYLPNRPMVSQLLDTVVWGSNISLININSRGSCR